MIPIGILRVSRRNIMIRVLYLGLLLTITLGFDGIQAQSAATDVLKWVHQHESLRSNKSSDSLSQYYYSLSIEEQSPLYAYLTLINETDDNQRTNYHKSYIANDVFGIINPVQRASIHSLLDLFAYPKASSSLLDELPSNLLPVISYELVISKRLEVYIENDFRDEFFEELRNYYKNLSELTKQTASKSVVGAANQSFNQQKLNRELLLYSILWYDYNSANYSSLLQWYNRHGRLEMLPKTEDKAKILMAIAYTQFSAGLYSEVLRLLEYELLELSELLDMDSIRFDTQNLYGVSLNQIGKYTSAEQLFQQLLLMDLSDAQLSQLYNNLGLSLLYQGKQLEYQKVMNKAYELAEQTKNALDMLIISENLFLQNIQYGNILGAEDYLVQAEKVAIELGSNTDLANIAYLKAIKLWDYEKNKREAVELLNQAMRPLNIEDNFFDWTRLLLKKAEVLMESQDYMASEKVMYELKKVALERDDVQLLFDANVFLAEVALAQNKSTDIPLLLNQLDEFETNNLRFSTFIRYQSLKNEWAFQQGFEAMAINNMQDLVEEIITRIQLTSQRESGFWLQIKAYGRAFSVLNKFYLEQEELEQSLLLMDRIKNLNQIVLGASELSLTQQLNEQEAARERYLREITQSLRSQYIREKDPNERAFIRSRLNQFESERTQLLNSIEEKLEIDNLTKRDLRVIQQKLDPNTLIIHINEVYDDLIIFAMDRQTLRSKSVSLDPEKQQLIRSAISKLQNGNPQLTQLFELYNLLNLPQWLSQEYNNLVVIQDPLLFGLPIDVLPIDNPEHDYSYGSANYVIEHWKVELYPSLQPFVEHGGNEGSLFAKNSLNFIGFGKANFNETDSEEPSPSLAYLKNAPIEVMEASKRVAGKVNIYEYLNEHASKQTFEQEVHKADILHIASHSIVNESNPLFSKIILSSSNQTDEALYAYELFNLDLNPRIAVLNACSSGSGNNMRGSGLLGFSRALLYSGTQGMMMNFWAVTDQSALQVSNEFYNGLVNKYTTSDAIRIAKLKLLENGNANPHYWGSFQYIGKPVYLKETPTYIFYLSSIMLLGLFWSLLFLRKEA